MANLQLMISKLLSLEDTSIWLKDSFTHLPCATMMFNLRKLPIFMVQDKVTKRAVFIKRGKTKSCLRTKLDQMISMLLNQIELSILSQSISKFKKIIKLYLTIQIKEASLPVLVSESIIILTEIQLIQCFHFITKFLKDSNKAVR
jgi:hypothetical protein